MQQCIYVLQEERFVPYIRDYVFLLKVENCTCGDMVARRIQLADDKGKDLLYMC